MTCTLRREEGTVLNLAIGGVLLVLVTVLVLSDVASLFMRRTALLELADSAAIAAASAVDVDAIYAQGVGSTLALDSTVATAIVRDTLAGADDARLRDVRLERVEIEGDVVRVELSAALPPPLAGITGARSLRIRAAASAATSTRF